MIAVLHGSLSHACEPVVIMWYVLRGERRRSPARVRVSGLSYYGWVDGEAALDPWIVLVRESH